MRIVSLLPSTTEVVCALGLGADLVGISHECDWPPEQVAGLPRLTAPRLEVHAADSATIHGSVQSLLEAALSIYDLDVAALRALRPDAILTQNQCAVCAVSEDQVAEAVRSFIGTAPQIVATTPTDLDALFGDMRRIAEALGVPDRGAQLVADLRDRLAALSAAVSSRARPSVAVLEWLDPPMAAGNWLPTLVEMAGGVNRLGEAGQHSAFLPWSDVVAVDPDVLVISPCGFPLAQTRREAPRLRALPGWSELTAVRTGRVILVDGNAYFNRPGPRVVESLAILAHAIHPTAPLPETVPAAGFEPFR